LLSNANIGRCILLKVLRQVALNRTNLPVRDFGVNLHRGEAEDELEVVGLAEFELRMYCPL
jgi:hypothetical protein